MRRIWRACWLCLVPRLRRRSKGGFGDTRDWAGEWGVKITGRILRPFMGLEPDYGKMGMYLYATRE